MTEKTRTRIPEWSFGDRLRKIRTDVGLDQREFAEKIGVKAPTLASYETGRATPRFRDVFTFAGKVEQETGVPAWWLIGSEPKPSDYKGQVRDIRTARKNQNSMRPGNRSDISRPMRRDAA